MSKIIVEVNFTQKYKCTDLTAGRILEALNQVHGDHFGFGVVNVLTGKESPNTEFEHKVLDVMIKNINSNHDIRQAIKNID